MRYFLDTNIFLRFLVTDNRQMHKDCCRLFALADRRRLKVMTSSFVFAEIIWVLQNFYKFSKLKIIPALKAFLGAGIRFEDKTDVFSAIQLFEKRNVKFVDCLIASNPAIRAGKTIIVSYDKDFDRLGVKRAEPGQLI